MKEWQAGAKRSAEAKKEIPIAIVGKYTHLDDAYLSVIESIKTAAVFEKRKAAIVWIDSEKLEAKDQETWDRLKSCAGIVVPGGFGRRGIEGKIMAARYAREEKKPYLGLCLGAQLLTIEFARHVLKDPKLTSQEFDEEETLDSNKYVVHFLPDQHKEKEKGGTLRLGAYECEITPGSKAWKAYASAHSQLATRKSQLVISERHRHRYEFNKAFKEPLEKAGLLFSGIWKQTGLAEIVELKDHPFMLGSQFHPEFKSRPHRPHPLFWGFLKAAAK
jgi:CTP synthase